MATTDNGGAPTLGDLVEQWVTENFPWTHEDERYYDHIGETGRKVQVKGTQKWISNGGDERTRGRWRFWENDHKRLKEDGGVYFLSLYEERADGSVQVDEWRIVDPETLEDAFPSDWWDETNTRRERKGRSYRMNWKYVFDPDDLS